MQQNINPQPDLLQQMSRLSLKNIPTDTETSQEKKPNTQNTPGKEQIR